MNGNRKSKDPKCLHDSSGMRLNPIMYGFSFNYYEISGLAYLYDHIGKKLVRAPDKDYLIPAKIREGKANGTL